MRFLLIKASGDKDMRILLNISPRWCLGWAPVMADTDWDRRIGWWLSGRLAGRDVSLYLPWRDRRRRTTQTTK